MNNMKYFVFLLLLVCVIAITACSPTREEDESTLTAESTLFDATEESEEENEETIPKETQMTEPYVTMPNGDPLKDPWIEDVGDELWTNEAK